MMRYWSIRWHISQWGASKAIMRYWPIRGCFGRWEALKLGWALDQSDDVLINERVWRLEWGFSLFLSCAWVNFLLNSRIGLMLKSVKNTILSLCWFWLLFSFWYYNSSSTSWHSHLKLGLLLEASSFYRAFAHHGRTCLFCFLCGQGSCSWLDKICCGWLIISLSMVRVNPLLQLILSS